MTMSMYAVHHRQNNANAHAHAHSVELRPPAQSGKQFLNVPYKEKHFKNKEKGDVILSESEKSPNSIVRPIKDDQHNIIDKELSYDVGQKQDFQDLPSLPMDDSNNGNGNGNGNKLTGSHRAFLGNYTKMMPPIQQQHEYSSMDASIELQLNQHNANSIRIQDVLIRNGFDKKYTKRALCVYEKHYADEYDIKIIREIIYRLQIKDKLKELKKIQNLYQSREAVKSLLFSLNFSKKYVISALTMYEIMAEMFEINKHHQNIYDLELVTEMIMRLRAKDRERGALFEEGDDMVFDKKQKRQKQPQQQGPKVIVTRVPQQQQQHQHKNEHDRTTSLLSLDASVPSSHGSEKLKKIIPNDNDLLAIIKDKRSQSSEYKKKKKRNKQRKKYNYEDYQQSTNGTRTNRKETTKNDHYGHGQGIAEHNLLNVIADKKSGNNKQNSSSSYTESDLIEVTINTNDMEIDGEMDDEDNDSKDDSYLSPKQHQKQKQQRQKQRYFNNQKSGGSSSKQSDSSLTDGPYKKQRKKKKKKKKDKRRGISYIDEVMEHNEEELNKHSVDEDHYKIAVNGNEHMNGNDHYFSSAVNAPAPPPSSTHNSTPEPAEEIGTINSSLDEVKNLQYQHQKEDDILYENEQEMDDDMDDMLAEQHDEAVDDDHYDDEEEEDYEQEEEEQGYDDFLPNIPNIRPGSTSNIMPIVADNLEANVEHKDIQIVETNEDTQSASGSSEIEYEEEYYEDEYEDDDEEDEDEYDEQYEEEDDDEDAYNNDKVGYRMKSTVLSTGSTEDLNVDYVDANNGHHPDSKYDYKVRRKINTKKSKHFESSKASKLKHANNANHLMYDDEEEDYTEESESEYIE